MSMALFWWLYQGYTGKSPSPSHQQLICKRFGKKNNMDINTECDEASVMKSEREFLVKGIWKLAVLFFNFSLSLKWFRIKSLNKHLCCLPITLRTSAKKSDIRPLVTWSQRNSIMLLQHLLSLRPWFCQPYFIFPNMLPCKKTTHGGEGAALFKIHMHRTAWVQWHGK